MNYLNIENMITKQSNSQKINDQVVLMFIFINLHSVILEEIVNILNLTEDRINPLYEAELQHTTMLALFTEDKELQDRTKRKQKKNKN